jgi:hypothetical protein
VCEIVSFPLQKKKKTSPLAVLTPFWTWPKYLHLF